MNSRSFCFLAIFSLAALNGAAQDSVAVRHWGGTVVFNPGNVLNMHHYTDRYDVPHRKNRAFAAEIGYSPLPSDSDAFASDYNYPTYGVGLKYAVNNSIRFSRHDDYEWPDGGTVDYDSYVGNSWAFYGFFTRPLLRTKHWMADLTVNAGTAYSHTKYDKHNNVDNELIGARWLIYFGAGLHLSYRFAPDFALKGGLEFWHLSNGALNRPNKGVNFLGPSIGLAYMPYYEPLAQNKGRKIKEPFNRYWYAEVTAGVGAKTLEEDWNRRSISIFIWLIRHRPISCTVMRADGPPASAWTSIMGSMPRASRSATRRRAIPTNTARGLWACRPSIRSSTTISP